MASRFPITRFSVNRVIRRSFVTEAVPEGFVSKRKGVEEHAKCNNFIILIEKVIIHKFYSLFNAVFYFKLYYP